MPQPVRQPRTTAKRTRTGSSPVAAARPPATPPSLRSVRERRTWNDGVQAPATGSAGGASAAGGTSSDGGASTDGAPSEGGASAAGGASSAGSALPAAGFVSAAGGV